MEFRRAWDARGLGGEARAWVDRCREALEDRDGQPPDFETPAGALWLFMVVSQANRSLQAGALAEAEAEYDAIRLTLEKSSSEQAKRRLAVAYHQLGRVAEDHGDLPGDESWYRKSLEITEALGDQPAMSMSYHQLGSVAEARGDLEGAESWYRKSLEIEESLGDRPGMAFTYGQLGLLALARGDTTGALDWTVRCVALFPEFPHPATGPGPHNLARLTANLGMPALEASWQRCTGGPLPEPVWAWVAARLEKSSA